LVEAGQFDEALAIGRELLGTLNYQARFTRLIEHRMARSMALAEAHTGQPAQARECVQTMIEREHGLGKSPLHLGRLHEALARIALLHADSNSFAHHLLQVRDYFYATRNPTLIKRYDRMAALGRSHFPAAVALESEQDRSALNALSALTAHTIPAARAACALELILREIDIDEGFLYLVRGSELELAASTMERQPPGSLQAMLTTMLSETFDESDITVTLSPDRESGSETTTLCCDRQEFVPVPLLFTFEGVREVVGIVAIAVHDESLFQPPKAWLLSAIAASLHRSSQTLDTSR
jgi:hypothetical protein